MNRTRPTLLALALLAAVPAASAQDVEPVEGSFGVLRPECFAQLVVQTQSVNHYHCDGTCVANVIVQVGRYNETNCTDACLANVVVQVGTSNSFRCSAPERTLALLQSVLSSA